VGSNQSSAIFFFSLLLHHLLHHHHHLLLVLSEKYSHFTERPQQSFFSSSSSSSIFALRQLYQFEGGKEAKEEALHACSPLLLPSRRLHHPLATPWRGMHPFLGLIYICLLCAGMKAAIIVIVIVIL
jgi:hypothetical protein